ncbi:Os02g0546400, partial [Oryza sativa Japonica Group]
QSHARDGIYPASEDRRPPRRHRQPAVARARSSTATRPVPRPATGRQDARARRAPRPTSPTWSWRRAIDLAAYDVVFLAAAAGKVEGAVHTVFAPATTNRDLPRHPGARSIDGEHDT